MSQTFKTEKGDVEVFPIGITQIPVIMQRLGKSASVLMTVLKGARESEMNQEQRASAALQMLPIVITDAFDIFLKCIKLPTEPVVGKEEAKRTVDIDSIPHEEFAPMILWWLDESFFKEGKLKPWISMATSLSERMSIQGKDLQTLVSSFSSGAASQE